MDLPSDFQKRGYFTDSVEPGVQTLLGHTTIFQRAFSPLVQGDDIRPAQTEVSPKRRALGIPLALHHNPQNPTSRAGWINDQIQTAPIAMPPSA